MFYCFTIATTNVVCAIAIFLFKCKANKKKSNFQYLSQLFYCKYLSLKQSKFIS